MNTANEGQQIGKHSGQQIEQDLALLLPLPYEQSKSKSKFQIDNIAYAQAMDIVGMDSMRDLESFVDRLYPPAPFDTKWDMGRYRCQMFGYALPQLATFMMMAYFD